MGFDKAKFLLRVVSESKDHVLKLREGLLTLEKHPEDEDTLNSVFRLAHTIKGASKMMKLSAISELSHKFEDVMDALRQKKIRHGKALSDMLFKGVAEIEKMLDIISAGNENPEIPTEICDCLEKIAKGELIEESVSLPEAPLDPKIPVPIAPQPSTVPSASVQSSPPLNPQSSFETIRLRADKLDELIKLMGEIVSGHSRSKQRLNDMKHIERLMRRHSEMMSDIGDKFKEEMLQTAKSLHIALKKLLSDFREDANIQSLLTADLQDRSLKLRMIPLSTIFDTFRMTVRDLSYSSGKEADLIIEGGETELDKKIIEKMGDSLMHMIRNAIVHGIETPKERIRIGKPGIGIIRLSARYEGGNVVIELSDDGAGIPVSRLREIALRKKIFDETEIAAISDTDIINLIFKPGFSSSDIITDLSGRGVGMDVVKKNIIEDLKGAIRIRTDAGQGTCFHIRLPLTIAIIRVLFIRVSDTTFAVPAHFIHEIIRVSENDLIRITDKQAVKLRDQIIPMICVRDLLNLPGVRDSISKSRSSMLVLIATIGDEKLGMVIDDLLNEEDVVVKPLPLLMKNLQWVSGVVISGKDELFNVLHIPKIIESAKETKTRPMIRDSVEKTAEETKAVHILVADDSVTTRDIEKSILESYGYTVTVAGDGMEALEKAKDFRYDLVITDVEMPRLDGFSLTEKLRAEDAYKHTPIILVTSLDKEEDKKRGITVGADAYIIKGSFDQSALLESVQHLLG